MRAAGTTTPRTARTARRVVRAAAAALTVLLLTGCAGAELVGEMIRKGSQEMTEQESMTAEDAAGMTRAEVEALTLEQQFALVDERYARLNTLLTDAQLVISDSDTVWIWGGGGMLPTGGGNGGVNGAMPGSDDDNSYYLTDGRIIHPPGAVGAKEDLEPMRKHYEAQGWETDLQELGGDYRLWANTGDGYRLVYGVQTNGRYYITVYSELFWGDFGGLQNAIADRSPHPALEESLPGVFTPFPKWTDPIIEPKK